MKQNIFTRTIFHSILIISIVSLVSCEITKVTTEPSTGENANFAFLSGKIIDNETSAGIPQVQVSFGATAVVSDDDGNFDLSSALAEGTYQVVVTKNGYFPVKRSITIPPAMEYQAILISFSMMPKKPTVNIIANNGGTIGVNDQQTLQIPANALSQSSNISVSNILGGGIPIQSSNKFIIEAVALEPNGLAFLSPANLQVPLNIAQSEFSNSTVHAASVDQLTEQWEELSGLAINTPTGKLSVPINHFCYVIFYISENVRFTHQPFIDSVATTTIASCEKEKVTQKVTVRPKINFSSISTSLIEANLGISLNSSITRVGSITHAKYDKIHQLQYQVHGVRYIIEKLNNGSWIQIASVDNPLSITFSLKQIGICHDQGIIRPQ